MRLSFESGTVEATPKFQNTNKIDQIAQSSHQGGANFNGNSNNMGDNQESQQVAIHPTVTHSHQIPNFPNSSANYFTNKSIIREANDNERIDSHFICTCDRCSGRINFDNQIHFFTLQQVSTYEELVAVTQKYAKRVQMEQNDKDKRLFVNAFTNTQTDSLLIYIKSLQ
jgi:hypothetical protein